MDFQGGGVGCKGRSCIPDKWFEERIGVDF